MNKLYILIMALTFLLSGCEPSTEEIAAKARLETELTFVKDELKKTEEKLAETKQQLEAAQEIVNATPKVTTIEGEVFITTQGAGSYTFSGVEIFAYDLDNYTTYFKNKKTELLEAVEAYIESEGAKTFYESYQASKTKREKLKDEYNPDAPYDPRWDFIKRQNAANEAYRNSLDKVIPIRDGYHVLLNLHLPDYIATDFPPIAQSRSDSKGVFELKIPKGKSVAVVASATRLHDGKTERYYWIAASESKNNSAIKLFLSGGNLISSDSNPYNIAPLKSPNDYSINAMSQIIDAF